MVQVLGPLHLCGRPGRTFSLLTSAWPSHFGCESVDGQSLCISPYFNSAFQRSREMYIFKNSPSNKNNKKACLHWRLLPLTHDTEIGIPVCHSLPKKISICNLTSTTVTSGLAPNFTSSGSLPRSRARRQQSLVLNNPGRVEIAQTALWFFQLLRITFLIRLCPEAAGQALPTPLPFWVDRWAFSKAPPSVSLWWKARQKPFTLFLEGI